MAQYCLSISQRKLAERQVDPVTLKYRDEQKQSMYDTLQTDKMREKVKSVESSRAKTYNIVSHIGPRRKIDDVYAEVQKRTVVVRPYHILSNMSHSDHKDAPFFLDENYTMERAGVRHTRVNTLTDSKRREFNIINNHFSENHSQRKRADYERMKDHLLKKYWESHKYDPIRCKDYDVAKEREHTTQQRKRIEETMMMKASRIPQAVKDSEGNAYNVINHIQYDTSKPVRAPGAVDEERKLNRMKKRYEIDKRLREEGQLLSTFAEKASISRVSYKRWEQQLDRGFDTVKNNIITQQAMPLPPRPATMWSRLQTSNSVDGSRSLHGTWQQHGPSPQLASSLSDSVEHFLNTAPEQQLHSSLTRTLHPLSNEVEEINRQHNQHYMKSKTKRFEPTPPTGRIRNLSGAGPRLRTTGDAVDNAPPQRDGSPSGSIMSRSDHSASQQSVRTFEKFSNAVTMPHMPPSSNSARLDASAPASGKSRSDVPALDLSLAEPPETVSYVEPSGGAPKGLPIPMVRTGGMSGFRD